MRRGQLTDRQHAILQRVADGDDLADAPTGEKVSATALHGQYPDKTGTRFAMQATQPVNRHPAANTSARQPPAVRTPPARSRPKRPLPHTTAKISAERRAAAIELVDELVAAGEKAVKNPDDENPDPLAPGRRLRQTQPARSCR